MNVKYNCIKKSFYVKSCVIILFLYLYFKIPTSTVDFVCFYKRRIHNFFFYHFEFILLVFNYDRLTSICVFLIS